MLNYLFERSVDRAALKISIRFNQLKKAAGVIASILDPLNPAQREAVCYTDGPLLVIAGAGSGKTRVITHRIAYLIVEHGVAPWRIFAATFTNKAAGEMKRRVLKLLSLPPTTRLSIATFHSLCATILRKEGSKIGLSPRFIICDERDQVSLIKECITALDLKQTDIPPQHVQWFINQAKIRSLGPSDLDKSFTTRHGEVYGKLYELYQRRLQENDAVDFEDLILHVVNLFQNDAQTLQHYQRMYQHILVDEYQDTNYLQYLLVKALAAEHRQICVVGDEDQSIYSWRGAELSNLLDFQKHFPEAKLVRLEQNYRSVGNILKAAGGVIANNKRRLGKSLWTTREDGERIYLLRGENEYDEAREVVSTILELHYNEGLPYSSCAIFYRQNSISRCLEDALRERNIPYRVIGGIRFYDRAEIKDLVAYLNVVVNPENSLSLRRIINKPRRGLGDKSILKIDTLASERAASFHHALLQAIEDEILSQTTVRKAQEFLAMLADWRSALKRKTKPLQLLETILQDTRYVESLGDEKSLEVIMKKENIEELKNAIAQYFAEHRGVHLEDFLSMVALASHQDELRDDEESVSLMTIHCAKGLEFDVVFIVAMEEPIFPNRRSVEESGDLEEERRLFYVGMTRARKRCFLSRAECRNCYGTVTYNVPSLFLRELPHDVTQEIRSQQTYYHTGA
jgi:DNA helicase-2/ATP-dependent DNA helicase PcrA